MTVADDLRAARALIDTPEKWGRVTEIVAVLMNAVGGSFVVDKILPMADALDAQSPSPPSGCIVRPYVYVCESPMSKHADIMALFDRAIASAESSNTEGARE